jgi:hypothetical protein
VDALVRGHHDARVLGQTLHLLLHVARVVSAPVVAPAWADVFRNKLIKIDVSN